MASNWATRQCTPKSQFTETMAMNWRKTDLVSQTVLLVIGKGETSRSGAGLFGFLSGVKRPHLAAVGDALVEPLIRIGLHS